MPPYCLPNFLLYLPISSFPCRIKELKCPDALADHYKPFSCRMQEWTLKHALSLLLACALVISLLKEALLTLNLKLPSCKIVLLC